MHQTNQLTICIATVHPMSCSKEISWLWGVQSMLLFMMVGAQSRSPWHGVINYSHLPLCIHPCIYHLLLQKLTIIVYDGHYSRRRAEIDCRISCGDWNWNGFISFTDEIIINRNTSTQCLPLVCWSKYHLRIYCCVVIHNCEVRDELKV